MALTDVHAVKSLQAKKKRKVKHMFGTRWAELKVKVTELELRIDKLGADYRSLEREWTATASKYDAILKRANRLIKLDEPPKEIQTEPAQLEEIDGDQILDLYYRRGGR